MPKRSPVARRRRALKRVGRRKSKRSGKKLTVPKGITTTQSQYCTVTETIQVQDIQAGVQGLASFNLMQFTRARFMALAFRHYKAAKCTWTYEPLFNTFANDTSGNNDTVPYLYSAMNRTGDGVAPNNLAAFQAMGARPVKFLRKHNISYVPNWNSPGMPFQVNDTEFMLGAKLEWGWIDSSPYLSKNRVATGSPPATQEIAGQLFTATNPQLPSDVGAPGGTLTTTRNVSYSVEYNGHDVIFDQFTRSGDLIPIGRLTLTVEWHFKTPVWWSRLSQNSNDYT